LPSAPEYYLAPCPPQVFGLEPPATTETCPPSLHDALPISCKGIAKEMERDKRHVDYHMRKLLELDCVEIVHTRTTPHVVIDVALDRKSTRLNSSHVKNSYAVFCLKKKKKQLARCALPAIGQ